MAADHCHYTILAVFGTAAGDDLTVVIKVAARLRGSASAWHVCTGLVAQPLPDLVPGLPWRRSARFAFAAICTPTCPTHARAAGRTVSKMEGVLAPHVSTNDADVLLRLASGTLALGAGVDGSC